jgi:hypothetical protein
MKQLKDLAYAVEITSYDHTDNMRPLYGIVIEGSRGRVSARDMSSVIESYDYISWLYNEITLVLDGYYHCCLTDRSFWA